MRERNKTELNGDGILLTVTVLLLSQFSRCVQMQAEYLVDHLQIDRLEVVYKPFPSTIESSGSRPGNYKNQGITTITTTKTISIFTSTDITDLNLSLLTPRF